MNRIVTNAGGLGDHGHGPFHKDADHPQQQASDTPPAADNAPEDDVRLVIESDDAEGGFIYKTIDHRTGAVLHVFARDGLLKLGQAPEYAAGSVIKTRA